MTNNKKSKSKKEDVIVEQCEDVIVKAKQNFYYVCKGKTITSKKGLILSGQHVTEHDLQGGKDSLDALLHKGCVELR